MRRGLLTGSVSVGSSGRSSRCWSIRRGAPLECYRGDQVLKANRVEAKSLSEQERIVPSQDALQAAAQIREQGDVAAVIGTLDQDECVLAQADGHSGVFATRVRSVCDVTGAGDMFLAMLRLCVSAET